MSRPENVVFTLAALEKPAQSTGLFDGMKAIAPSGEDFVAMRLMSDVPNDPVSR